MGKVIIIGGGAAGMMAAIRAAGNGNQVTLLEQNEKLGKKLYITGKGRCNITNDCDTEDLLKHVTRNSKFLYSAFYSFDSRQVMDFFEKHGLAIKTERGGRVFPQSDHSSDVIRTLQNVIRQQEIDIQLHAKAADILIEGGDRSKVAGVRLADGRTLEADKVIIATGGCSYPSTGATGDGYGFAELLGHTVTPQQPSLVPFETAEDWVRDLQGLSLKNVTVRIRQRQKLLFEDFGEMIFTHYGVSGPLIISASSIVGDYRDGMPFSMEIDLKPALTEEQLDKRILRDFENNQNRQFKNALSKLFPAKLIPVIIRLSSVGAEAKVNAVTKEQRMAFVHLIKHFPLTLERFRGFDEAIITRGGVCIKEVNPSTMESKLVSGLYFAGEVLDLDALTGGFNLQIAWSTGYLAGDSI